MTPVGARCSTSTTRIVRQELARFGGREIDTTGDGFLATFDGPGRAIRCARAIRDALARIGLAVRAGVHTGEVEVRGERIGGLAVHIGARVAATGGGGDIVVSSTVKDLLAGSGLTFADRGEHELKGVPGTWRLFAAEPVDLGAGLASLGHFAVQTQPPGAGVGRCRWLLPWFAISSSVLSTDRSAGHRSASVRPLFPRR